MSAKGNYARAPLPPPPSQKPSRGRVPYRMSGRGVPPKVTGTPFGLGHIRDLHWRDRLRQREAEDACVEIQLGLGGAPEVFGLSEAGPLALARQVRHRYPGRFHCLEQV